MKFNAIIVEDELNSSHLLKVMITTFHPEIQVVDICTNAKDALMSLLKFKPDLLFLDIQMPGMSGLEFIEKLSEFNYPFQTIITTAFSHPQYYKKAVQLGMADYLVKPILKEDLDAAIENAVRRLRNAQLNQLPGQVNNENGSEEKISLNTGSSRVFIKPETIVYASSDGKYSKLFFTNMQEESVMHGIGDLAELLSSRYFHKIDRFTIVNRKYVHKISPRLRMVYFNFNDHLIQLEISHSGALHLLEIMETAID